MTAPTPCESPAMIAAPRRPLLLLAGQLAGVVGLLIGLGASSVAPSGVIARAASTSPGSGATVAASPAAAGPRRQVFLNVNALQYQSMLMADALAEGRNMAVPGTNSTVPVAVDAAGWPKADFEILWIVTGQQYAHGTYGIDFVGRAEVDFPGALRPPTVSPLAYDPATNRTTGTVRFAPGTLGNVAMTFRRTRRSNRPDASRGLTEFHLYRPTEVGGKTPHSRGELFNRQDLAMLAPFAGVRTLNLMLTNGNPGRPFDEAANRAIENTGRLSPRDRYLMPWADRRLPSSPIQTHVGGHKELALEYQIALANADPRGIKGDQALHMPIPDYASDEWVDNFYLMCRWGSDGVLPHTGPPGSTTANPHSGAANPQPAGGPKWAPLHGPLYVEYSNEITFNFFGGFDQAGRNVRLAQAEVAAGKSDLAWDGKTPGDAFVINLRRVGKQVKRLSDRGKAILAPGAYGTTFFPVLMGQQSNPAALQGCLDYLEHAVGAANVNQVITHGGCGFYREFNTRGLELIDLTTSQIIGAGAEPITDPAAHLPLCKKYGLKFLGYEGGQTVFGGDHDRTWVPLHRDPRTWRLTRSCIDEAFAADPIVEVLEIFADTAGQWAILESPGQRDTPEAGKYRATVAALRAWAANPRDGSDPSPLPPTAEIKSVSIAVPPGPIVPGKPLQLAGTVAGSGDPIPLLNWIPSEGAAPKGVLTVPAAANRPRTIHVKVAAAKNPAVHTSISLTIPADPAAAPPLADPSFEIGTIPAAAPAGFVATPSGTGWSWAGSCGISLNSIGYGGRNEPTPAAAQFAFVQSRGSISQRVTGWSGGAYRVSFVACQRVYNGQSQALSIRLDGVEVGHWSANGGDSSKWATFQTRPFAVTAGDHTLTIAGTTDVDATALVDSVGLTRVAGG